MERLLTTNPHLSIKVCFFCYRAHPHWLIDLLSQCEDMEIQERQSRIKMTLADQCVTVLAIDGSQKDLCIFPETVDGCQEKNALNGDKIRSVHEIL